MKEVGASLPQGIPISTAPVCDLRQVTVPIPCLSPPGSQSSCETLWDWLRVGVEVSPAGTSAGQEGGYG